MNILEKLSVDHDYYCKDSNYFSNDASTSWDTMTDFLDCFDGMDIDLNLVFRWDIYKDDDRYIAKVYIMHQRKGIFSPHYINMITENEAVRFYEYLRKHWIKLQQIWSPISTAICAAREVKG